jgi:hypothetical protein
VNNFLKQDGFFCEPVQYLTLIKIDASVYVRASSTYSERKSLGLLTLRMERGEEG